VEKAGVYARAAVENRVAAYSRRAREAAAVAMDWVEQAGADAWARGRALLGIGDENRGTAKPVDEGGQGGKQP
jgi:hypothetical protein